MKSQARVIQFAVFFSLCSILLQHSAFGQKYFVDGFIIKHSGDTISGLLNYKGETKNSETCTFRRSQIENSVDFLPNDIFGYKFEPGKYYVSKKFNIDGSEKWVFAEVLFVGIYNLYFYRQDRQIYYFIEDADGDVWELKNEKINYTRDGRAYSKMSKEYVSTLKVLFSDNLSIQRDIEQSERSHKALIKLTNDYHQFVCPDVQCSDYQESLPKVLYTFAPEIGFASNTVSIAGYPYDDFRFGYSMAPQIGLRFNTSVPRVNYKLSLELASRISRHYLASTYSWGDNYMQHHDLYLDYYQLLNNLSMKYTYPKGKFKPFVSIGISLVVNMDQKTRYILETESNYHVRSYEYDEQLLPNSMLGGVIELGVLTYKNRNPKWFINAYYSMNNGAYQKPDRVQHGTKLRGIGFSVGTYL